MDEVACGIEALLGPGDLLHPTNRVLPEVEAHPRCEKMLPTRGDHSESQIKLLYEKLQTDRMLVENEVEVDLVGP